MKNKLLQSGSHLTNGVKAGTTLCHYQQRRTLLRAGFISHHYHTESPCANDRTPPVEQVVFKAQGIIHE
jgi:hypothetical protein